MIDLLVAAAVAPVQAETAGLVGRWEGELAVGAVRLPIVVRVTEGPDGVAAVMDSPAQNARDIPVTGLSLSGGVVRFSVPAVGGSFEGTTSADGGSWTGVIKQGPASLPLVLTRGAPGAEPAGPDRPQTPHAPFPYVATDVTFANTGAGLSLAGTLTTPQGPGPFPAVVLLTGSGSQDRDETIFDHKPFAVWADALTRHGVAVLRFDDRGVGGSGPRGPNDTTADFTTDAEAAIAFLRTRPEIDPARIGLMGHSEGGAMAPLAALHGAPVAFVVMLAGQAVTGADIITEQAARIAEASGQTPEQVDAVRQAQARIMAAVVANKDDGAAAAAAVQPLIVATGQTPDQAAGSVALLSSRWYRWFAAYDPTPALEALHVPLLAVFGGKDLQVPADQNAEALERIKPDAEVVILPGLNHLMQTAGTGLPNEYGTITETVSPTALQTVGDWIVRTTAR